MRVLLKNLSFRNNHLVSLLFALFFNYLGTAQIANYVNNGSFENYFTSFIYNIPNYWRATDSLEPFGVLLISPNGVPLNSYAYQWPKQGKNYFISIQYCPTCGYQRAYPCNRLKRNLEPGKIYCVSMYVNLSNQSTHGIDAIGAYFGDVNLDTIQKCNSSITYLIPQIENPVNNIITDTLNWVPITGTFVANGKEKYMLIGNFKSDINTNKTLVNPANLPTNAADYLIDAVSVTEVDLPAYAGPDQAILSGDSAFIGRAADFAIDPGCTWFKLPEMTPLDTISGMWVRPAVTTTYVVRQILDCSSEKWDTVVVYMNLVGLGPSTGSELNYNLKIYPVPANDFLELKISNKSLFQDFTRITIYNNVGQIIKEEDVFFKNEKININISDFAEGVYSFQLKSKNNETVTKRFVISH